MSKFPSSWFSNPRPLPLDENGKVDFSKESETIPQPNNNVVPSLTNPVRGKYLVSLDMHNRLNYPQVIFLQNGHSIIIADALFDGTTLSKHDINHNIFRLDVSNNVVWQVQRDEQGCYFPDSNDRDPFGELWLEKIAPKQYRWLEPPPLKRFRSSVWIEGHKLIALTSGYPYEINIETGIAINIFQGGRPW